LFKLNEGLGILKNLSGVKFAYAVAKNKVLISKEIEALQESRKPNEKFKEYDKKRVELCISFADKDEKNKPIIVNNQYQITKKEAFNIKINELQEENKKIIEEVEKKQEEYLKMLEEETDLKFFMIKQDDLPKEITVSQMDIVIDLIEE